MGMRRAQNSGVQRAYGEGQVVNELCRSGQERAILDALFHVRCLCIKCH